MMKIIGIILAVLANGIDALVLFEYFREVNKDTTLGIFFAAFISTPLILGSLIMLFGRVDHWVLFAVAFIPAIVAVWGFTKLL